MQKSLNSFISKKPTGQGQFMSYGGVKPKKKAEEQKKSVNDPIFSNYVDNIWTKEERDTSGRIKNLSMVNANNQCSLDTLLTWAQSNSSRSLNIFHTICSEKDVDQNPDLANWFFLLHSSFGNDIAKFNYDTISKLHMVKSAFFQMLFICGLR